MKETKLNILSAHERKIKFVAQRTSGWFQRPRGSQETWGCENQNEIIVKDYEPVVNKSLNTENAENVFKVLNVAKQ